MYALGYLSFDGSGSDRPEGFELFVDYLSPCFGEMVGYATILVGVVAYDESSIFKAAEERINMRCTWFRPSEGFDVFDELIAMLRFLAEEEECVETGRVGNGKIGHNDTRP